MRGPLGAADSLLLAWLGCLHELPSELGSIQDGQRVHHSNVVLASLLGIHVLLSPQEVLAVPHMSRLISARL